MIESSTNWYIKKANICNNENEVRNVLKQPVLIDKYFNPVLLKDFKKVVTSLLHFKQKSVRLYGDYDTDGVLGVCTGVLGLKKFGFTNVSYQISKRDRGYGLCKLDVDEMKADGVELILTVDNGIACKESVDYAKSLGIEVIVTDHHNPSKEGHNIPDCLILNPKLEGCEYPNKELCGTGVMFKLIQSLLGVDESKFLLPLVAIATIVDAVSVLGENRKLLIDGITLMQEESPIIPSGLRDLLKELQVTYVDEETCAYIIGPVLNAPGRLEDARLSADVILGNIPPKVIIDINERRKLLTAEHETLMLHNVFISEAGNLALAVNGYHEGLLGSLSSRLKNVYDKFCVVINNESDIFRGSVRCCNINVYSVLAECSDLLISYGGHENAGGFFLKKENYEAFRERLIKIVDSYKVNNRKYIDLIIPPEHISISLIQYIDSLKPFGPGNSKPCIGTTLNVKKALVMKEDNVRFIDQYISGVCYGRAKKYEEIGSPKSITVVGDLCLNEFQDKICPQIIVQDFWENK